MFTHRTLFSHFMLRVQCDRQFKLSVVLCCTKSSTYCYMPVANVVFCSCHSQHVLTLTQ